MPQPPTPPRRPEYSVKGGYERVRLPPDPVPPAPEAPQSTAPVSAAPAVHVEIPELGFDAKVRGHALRRLAPWLVPAVMSLLGTIGGWGLGYFQGLKAAAARVAALELETDTVKAQLRQRQSDDDRLFTVTGDHDARLLRLERALKLEVPVVVRSPGP